MSVNDVEANAKQIGFMGNELGMCCPGVDRR